MAAVHTERPDQWCIFKHSLSKKSYCTDRPDAGLRIRNVKTAIKQRYIQPNQKNAWQWLALDVDRPICVDQITDDLGLPAPTFLIQNPVNHHAHVLYGLETPVHLNQNSSQDAIRYAAAIHCAITEGLQADRGYAGLIVKNPLNDYWWTQASNSDSYSLGQLSEYLDLPEYRDRRKNLPDLGLGRNVNLFERLRRWAYKAIRQGWPDLNQWGAACLDRAMGYNNTDNPLPLSEVKAIARSVAKWTHRHITPQSFSAVQAGRGALNGKRARDEHLQAVIEMKLQGYSVRVIANTLGLSKSTVDRWLKRDC